MWYRKELKSEARLYLREHYWEALLACLIVYILLGGLVAKGYNGAEEHIHQGLGQLRRARAFNHIINLVQASLISLFSIFSIIISLFFLNILEIGRANFFLKSFAGQTSIKNIFRVFTQEGYFNLVKVQFLKKIYIFFWSLLFILPGIVKKYEYRMIPYILAEKPMIDPDEAFAISRAMTWGHKFDIFILDLSFIGWKFISAVLMGLGILFLDPYIRATDARLYIKLKEIYKGDGRFERQL